LGFFTKVLRFWGGSPGRPGNQSLTGITFNSGGRRAVISPATGREVPQKRGKRPLKATKKRGCKGEKGKKGGDGGGVPRNGKRAARSFTLLGKRGKSGVLLEKKKTKKKEGRQRFGGGGDVKKMAQKNKKSKKDLPKPDFKRQSV